MAYDVTGYLILLLARLIEIYYWLIFARVILSWFIRDPSNPIYRFLHGITEPVLGPIRRIMPNLGLDFSPMIAFLLLEMIKRFLIRLY